MEKKNQFAPVSDAEKKKREQKRIEHDKAMKDAEKAAQACLNDPKFVKYKEKYAYLQGATVDALIEYDEPNPDIYNSCVRVMLAKLKQLKLLVHNVEMDNRKKK